jgi:molecular chaperone DnaK (HSP70)
MSSITDPTVWAQEWLVAGVLTDLGFHFLLLIQDAEAYLKTPVNRAVITVPAYFTPEQCDATERAGKLAGTDILALTARNYLNIHLCALPFESRL